MDIQRGWFYLADLNPQRGTEPGKTRPVLVLQTDELNAVGHPSTVVLPLTSHIQDDARPLRVRVPAGSPGFEVDSDVMVDQVRAVENRRFYRGQTETPIKKIARADDALLLRVEQCLKQVLDL